MLKNIGTSSGFQLFYEHIILLRDFYGKLRNGFSIFIEVFARDCLYLKFILY